MQPATYILASGRNGTLYVGVTSDLVKRIPEHRNGIGGTFTRRYGVHRLVHFELYNDIRDAIAREHQIKEWNRTWKLELIERDNPAWRDLYPSICDA